MMMRLDKYLAEMGIGTRTEVKKLIRQGKIEVDGEVTTKPEQKIEPTVQKIYCNGKQIEYTNYEYYMLHKPAGVVSATFDKNEKTVMDLIKMKKRKDLFPVGRLDKDTEGLLLITNDGALAHNLLSPKKHVDKVYYVKVRGRLTQEDVIQFERGFSIGNGEVVKSSILDIVESADISDACVTIQEGKYHQVKRMFAAVGKKVIYLKRLSMGNLWLDEDLPIGEYRPLTEEELQELKESC